MIHFISGFNLYLSCILEIIWPLEKKRRKKRFNQKKNEIIIKQNKIDVKYERIPYINACEVSISCFVHIVT